MTPVDKHTLLTEKLAGSFAHEITETVVHRGQVTHVVEPRAIASVCNFLKTDPNYRMNYLVDILGVDYPGREPRFDVVYIMYSTTRRMRVRLKTRVSEGGKLQSVTSVWAGANWPEREVYDMYGVEFEGHPELERIYLPEDFDGYPLRKDYPLRGYKDRYNPFGEEKAEEE